MAIAVKISDLSKADQKKGFSAVTVMFWDSLTNEIILTCKPVLIYVHRLPLP